MEMIDGVMLKEMLYAASGHMNAKKEYIDSLNVFPVPDGDTGTNMGATMAAVIKEVKGTNGSNEIRVIADALSLGALKGARGNSGVILSQILRGFAQSLSHHGRIDTKALAHGLAEGSSSAYKAVMRPKEGTILTVIRHIAKVAGGIAEKTSDIDAFFAQVLIEGENILNQTPEMLPVLKQAGVVDAGGMGLIVILQGFRMAINGQSVEEASAAEETSVFVDVHDLDEINFTYCTEILVNKLRVRDADREIARLRAALDGIGDCVLVVGDMNMIKVHVHTDTPDVVIQHGLRLGSLSSVKVENMREQNEALEQKNTAAEEKTVAMVAVSDGEGFDGVFTQLLADQIIPGGQSMNPSAEDIGKAVELAPSKNVIVLPNNKNIVMAAKQAAEITEKNVVVIPSVSLPQGIAAAMNFIPEETAEQNEARMKSAIGFVHSAQLTRAVRDSSYEKGEIKQGDVLGILDGDIVETGADMDAVAVDVARLAAEKYDCSMVTLFYGADVEEAQAGTCLEKLQAALPDCETDMQYGGQQIYDYIFSIE